MVTANREPLRPPRTSGDPAADYAALIEYLWGLYRSILANYVPNSAIGTTIQPTTEFLVAIAPLIPSADRLPYTTSASAAALATFTAFARTLVDDADAAAARLTLGLGTLAIANSISTSDIADDAVTYSKIQNISSSDRVLGRASIGAGDTEEILCTAAGRAILDDANATDQRATLGLGTMSVQDASAVAITGGTVITAALGDTLYGAAAGVTTALSGNITATRKFLTQTGTGAVSAVPIWETLLAAELNAAYGFTLTGTAGQTYTLNSTLNILSTTVGIDAKTIATTNLYTVPAGKTAIITGAVVRVTAATAITVVPTLGIGIAAGEDDVFASTVLTGLDATTKVFKFTASATYKAGAAAEVIKLGVDVGATATTMTISIDLIGYLL